MKLIKTSKFVQKLKGGLADDDNPEDFPKKELAKGIKVEKEHTDNDSVAEEIAMDHLKENKHYYDCLEKMEKECEDK